jgi:hypothetical protein
MFDCQKYRPNSLRAPLRTRHERKRGAVHRKRNLLRTSLRGSVALAASYRKITVIQYKSRLYLRGGFWGFSEGFLGSGTDIFRRLTHE